MTRPAAYTGALFMPEKMPLTPAACAPNMETVALANCATAAGMIDSKSHVYSPVHFVMEVSNLIVLSCSSYDKRRSPSLMTGEWTKTYSFAVTCVAASD